MAYPTRSGLWMPVICCSRSVQIDSGLPGQAVAGPAAVAGLVMSSPVRAASEAHGRTSRPRSYICSRARAARKLASSKTRSPTTMWSLIALVHGSDVTPGIGRRSCPRRRRSEAPRRAAGLVSHRGRAFSPTDTMPLSRWAKMGMTVQATVSIVTVALVVARAVNVLR